MNEFSSSSTLAFLVSVVNLLLIVFEGSLHDIYRPDIQRFELGLLIDLIHKDVLLSLLTLELGANTDWLGLGSSSPQ